MSTIERIRSTLKTLSPSERRVAELLLKKPDVFIKMPVGEIAEKAQVSKPTVIRLCRTIGYLGLSDMKLQLAASLAQGIPFIHKTVLSEDTGQVLATKVIDNAIHAFEAYKLALNPTPIEKSVNAIELAAKAGGRIEFYGVGNSGIVAQDAQHKLFRMGINTIAYADGHLQIMAASLLKKKDCLVIISNSGRSRDLLDACEIAKKTGATTIAITETGSPLASMCHIHIPADHTEEFDHYSPMISRLLHLLIVDIISTALAVRRSEVVGQQMAMVKRNLQKKRYRS